MTKNHLPTTPEITHHKASIFFFIISSKNGGGDNILLRQTYKSIIKQNEDSLN